MSTPPPDGIRLWRLSVAALALALAPWGASAQRVVYDGPGVTVPADFGCWHDVGYVVNWPKLGGQDLYHGPDPAFRVRANRVRLYGMGGWSGTSRRSRRASSTGPAGTRPSASFAPPLSDT